MKTIAKSGGALAAAALTLAVGFASVAPANAASSGGEKVHCYGVNACKGQSECKSANSSCKGQNACKAQGWIALDTNECTTRGGTPKFS
jgi:uncharacterized membrane protein